MSHVLFRANPSESAPDQSRTPLRAMDAVHPAADAKSIRLEALFDTSVASQEIQTACSKLSGTYSQRDQVHTVGGR